jgi:hypothetical protein
MIREAVVPALDKFIIMDDVTLRMKPTVAQWRWRGRGPWTL